MQARIQQARREAETLKDRIKRKKEELADTTRELPPAAIPPIDLIDWVFALSSRAPCLDVSGGRPGWLVVVVDVVVVMRAREGEDCWIALDRCVLSVWCELL